MIDVSFSTFETLHNCQQHETWMCLSAEDMERYTIASGCLLFDPDINLRLSQIYASC
jgi:hypothetical protein